MTPPELQNLPQLPECADHVWSWWVSLSNKRQCGMSVNPIAEEAIGWFFYTRKITPKQWELDALDTIETEYISSVHTETTGK